MPEVAFRFFGAGDVVPGSVAYAVDDGTVTNLPECSAEGQIIGTFVGLSNSPGDPYAFVETSRAALHDHVRRDEVGRIERQMMSAANAINADLGHRTLYGWDVIDFEHFLTTYEQKPWWMGVQNITRGEPKPWWDRLRVSALG